MTLIKYRIFKKIYDTGSFTIAAKELNMTQSAISHAMKSLESELGFLLFRRNHNKFQMTTEANCLIKYVEDLLESERLLNENIKCIQNPSAGTLRIGSYSSASSLLLPVIIREFTRLFPNIKISIVEGNYIELRDSMDKGLIDVSFLAKEYLCDNYMYEFCFKDEMFLAVGSKYTDITQQAVSFKEVEKYPFILPDNACNKFLFRLFDKYKISPEIKYKIKLNTTVFSMVEQGLGISILSKSAISPTNYNINYYPFVEDISRTTYLVSNKDSYKLTTVKAFMNLSKNYISKILDNNYSLNNQNHHL